MLLAGLLLAGCRSSGPQFADVPGLPANTGTAPAAMTSAPDPVRATTASPATAAAPAKDSDNILDLLNPGDPVIITFADLPIPVQPQEDRIKEDGTITLLQNQTFRAAGKTRGELEREVHDRYVPKLFRTMTVTIQQQGQTRFYYVGGEVKQPNRQVYISKLTVLKAIQSAGDFTDFAKKTKVVLIRADGRKFIIDCKKAQQHPELDLDVYPGDKIHVPRRIF
jgi:protein involved in polysaccharide export with SLBB domain